MGNSPIYIGYAIYASGITFKIIITDKNDAHFFSWIRACFQIADGSPFGVQQFLEEFLNGWIVGDEQYCTVITEANSELESGHNLQFVLEIDKYMEVVELYTLTLLATVLNDVDLAISWVEKASLPEGKRQVN